MAEEVPAHLHSAIEMALKAALISRDFWDGCDDSFFIHDLRELAEELAGKGFPMPPDLLRYLRGASKIPRTGQRSCETHVQTEYADNLDWNRISLSDLFALAERTLEHVRNECGFS
jgi:HEPN domain-containing protein